MNTTKTWIAYCVILRILRQLGIIVWFFFCSSSHVYYRMINTHRHWIILFNVCVNTACPFNTCGHDVKQTQRHDYDSQYLFLLLLVLLLFFACTQHSIDHSMSALLRNKFCLIRKFTRLQDCYLFTIYDGVSLKGLVLCALLSDSYNLKLNNCTASLWTRSTSVCFFSSWVLL